METKDLIIGCVSNYEPKDIKPWVNSIKHSGFKGDVIVVGTNLTPDLINYVTSENIKLYAYGRQQPNGEIWTDNSISSFPPHVERFFYIWDVLTKLSESGNIYNKVITTDTRDVIFQKNPSEFLENTTHSTLITATEGLAYEHEPWGNQNLLQTFGKFFHDRFKSKIIQNVGVIAGDHELITGLMLLIFQMSINRPIPIVDQAVYNVLINTEPFNSGAYKTDHETAWAVNLGTTLQAIESGAGDIGQAWLRDPSLKRKYIQEHYTEELPIVDYTNGEVLNHNLEQFFIVHQWDRVPRLAELIKQKYGA